MTGTAQGNSPTAVVETPFDTWAGFRDAVLATLTAAQHRIMVFDPDLSQTGIASVAGVDALIALATRAPRADAIRILLRDSGYLLRDAARLHTFGSRFSHRLQVRTVREQSGLPDSCFMIGDDSTLILRFHVDMARGRCNVGPSDETARYVALFETLWEDAVPVSLLGTTGL